MTSGKMAAGIAMLDSLTRFELQDILLEVWEQSGKTVIMVTHDVDEALYLAKKAGRNRIANLVRSVTMSIEQTVGDLSHDLLHSSRRLRARDAAPRKRKRSIATRHDRSPPASSVKHAPEARSALRLRPPRPDS